MYVRHQIILHAEKSGEENVTLCQPIKQPFVKYFYR